MFLQHNPTAPIHGQIAWGHASSDDLARWEERPVASSPTLDGPDTSGCQSGVYVPEHDHPAVVYSGIADESSQSTVCFRWDSPDLLDWGASIVVGTIPEANDIGVIRDPSVFEYKGRKLAMVGVGLRDGLPAVLLYDRSDELAWRHARLLINSDPVLRGAGTVDIWGCPQLFPLDGRWALVASIHDNDVLGEVIATAGDLVPDGEGLRFVAESVHAPDDGADCYAPRVSPAGDEPLFVDWARQEAQDPAVRDHAGCLTLPRRLQLVGGLAVSWVDPGAAVALAGDMFPLGVGTTVFADRHWVVEVVGIGTWLMHLALGEVQLVLGLQLRVDGAVTELYRPSGVLGTWRHDEPRSLVVTSEGAVEAREVIPRVPRRAYLASMGDGAIDLLTTSGHGNTRYSGVSDPPDAALRVIQTAASPIAA